jgi:hypothetical protein
MPYDTKGEWTPDPEDAKYTDPDASKYINKEGNDTRFGLQFSDAWVSDPPTIIELKKSGQWAKMPPIQRRWATQDYTPVSDDFSQFLKDLQKKTNEINKKMNAKYKSIINSTHSPQFHPY